MGNSNDTKKLIGALLVGAVIGGALGILFAPNKGSATRKKLTGRSEDLTDDMEDKFNDLLEVVRKEVDTVKKNANEFMSNAVNKAEKFKVN